jgi:cobalt-zinc-cadmium efflux system outer membrane protein
MKEKTQTKIVVALAAFFLAVSCATYHSKPISPAQTALTFESRTLDNPDLRRFIESNFNHEITSWPPRSWDFTTLTLVAFYYSSDLDVARAKWGAARAGVITAGQRQNPNPSATFPPEYATHSPTGISPWILSFALDIPIETAGKRGYRIAQAEHLSAAARRNIATVAWQVRSRLRTNLLGFFAAMETDSFLKKQLRVQEEIVGLLERRLAYGAISGPVATQAHISLDQARLSVDEAEREIAQYRGRLAESLGLPVAALDGIDISFVFLNEFPKELPSREIQKQALFNHPDILSALSQYEAAQSSLQLEIARQYPNLVIGPGYKYDQGENKWSIGISLSLPVLNQNQGPIAEAEARRKEQTERFIRLQARVIGEIARTTAGSTQ